MQNEMLLDYLPNHLRQFREFQEAFESQAIEINAFDDGVNSLVLEATIKQCSVERLSEWEKFLKIIPVGEVWQRRDFVIATLRGGGKLNEKKIANIVNAFTGGTATTTFINSTINVRILPPQIGDIFRLDDVIKTLNRLKPAHLLLEVERYYSTWQDIVNNFSNWGVIKTRFATWKEVSEYIQLK